MLLLVAICTVGNAYFVPNVQCACQQIITEQECNNWNCQWAVVSPATATTKATGYCQQVPCGDLNQTQCLKESYRCYYQESTQQAAIVCFTLAKCEDIQLAAGATCQSSNPSCVPSNLQKPQCIAAGLSCKNLTTIEQCQPAKGQTLADEGLCYWNGSCKVVSQCGDIATQNQCQLRQFQFACYWTGTKCSPTTCQQLSQENCKYVLQSPLTGAGVQPCNYIGTTCVDAPVGSLTQSTCSANTNSHYRWVPIESGGICAQCNPFKYVYRNQCECQQLLQQNECQSSGNCKWAVTTGTTYACQSLACADYLVQQQCAQVKGCYWNAAGTPQCTAYSSCSEIAGKNGQACVTLSIFCPGSNGTTCLSQVSLNSCSSITTPNICYNSIGKDGYCTYEPGSKACVNITSCSNLMTRQLCDQFSNSCIWKTGTSASCQVKTCSEYLTESSCTYIQNNINNNVLNICTWNPDTKKCNSFDNSFSYDVNSCFSSTGRTHHWSEPSNAQKGLCLPCHYSSVLNVKSNCSCKELTNYTDCALSSPKCYWNAGNSQCENQKCSQLTSQTQCILSKYCYWSNSLGCQATGSSTVTCSQLSANTQQECLSQSIICAGISGGKCSSSLNNCSDFSTFYQCFGSVGTDGICQWNQASSKCQGISNCNMINTQAQCELVLNTCYWDASANGTCSSYNCTSLYTQTKSCNFYLSTPNQNYKVNSCYLTNGTCTSAPNLESLTSSTCYASTGGTARWDSGEKNGTCVMCYSQIISVLFIILSYMF
ncbi:unnamed protein product (macronuclear) [Paramecium tetraurelia]|uniref:Mini antigen n=1 Tax=Paramecium tetraurelia TaxID=5888 RepID=A0EAU0_PARTE|nr:uncharacterized protein GSPATT00025141001 [Paramecium tetraurelia]CAK92407.1 unnamed protein product [Paramecium tetraurelia]|eukprot:XP_001459804.1 hypothetical protein (macronuclear) [Paramecium tetraurelia strain d4-2]